MKKPQRNKAAPDPSDTKNRKHTGILSDWEKLLVTEYMRDFNSAQTGIRLGLTGSRKNISGHIIAYLREPHIRAEVNRRLAVRQKHSDINEYRVLEELKRIAFGNPLMNCRVYDDEGHARFDPGLLTEEDMAGIASIEVTAKGTKIKMHDKLDALEKLGSRLKLFGKDQGGTTAGTVRFVIEDSPRISGEGGTRRIAAEITLGQRGEQSPDTKVIEHVVTEGN